MDLEVLAFLKDAELVEYADQLHELGLQKLCDLDDLQPEDLESAGLKTIQKRRFLRKREELQNTRSESKAHGGGCAPEAIVPAANDSDDFASCPSSPESCSRAEGNEAHFMDTLEDGFTDEKPTSGVQMQGLENAGVSTVCSVQDSQLDEGMAISNAQDGAEPPYAQEFEEQLQQEPPQQLELPDYDQQPVRTYTEELVFEEAQQQEHLELSCEEQPRVEVRDFEEHQPSNLWQEQPHLEMRQFEEDWPLQEQHHFEGQQFDHHDLAQQELLLQQQQHFEQPCFQPLDALTYQASAPYQDDVDPMINVDSSRRHQAMRAPTDLHLVVGVQTDLQDGDPVQKLVTSGNIVHFCNEAMPESARIEPKPHIDLAALANADAVRLHGIVGDRHGVAQCIYSMLGLCLDTVGTLQDCGLYALRQETDVYLFLWTPEEGWTWHGAGNKLLVNLVHYILQTCSHVIWAVSNSDLSTIREEVETAVRRRESRNIQWQIKTEAIREDSCQLGAEFCLPLPFHHAEQTAYLHASRNGLQVAMKWQQPSGSARVAQKVSLLRVWELCSDYSLILGDSLDLEQCLYVTEQVHPRFARELGDQHKHKARDLEVEKHDKRQAIESSEEQHLNQTRAQMRAFLDHELSRYPVEFGCIHRLGDDCPICCSPLEPSEVRGIACLPCSHKYHRHCLELLPASEGSFECPQCRSAVSRNVIVPLVDMECADELLARCEACADNSLEGLWAGECGAKLLVSREGTQWAFSYSHPSAFVEKGGTLRQDDGRYKLLEDTSPTGRRGLVLRVWAEATWTDRQLEIVPKFDTQGKPMRFFKQPLRAVKENLRRTLQAVKVLHSFTEIAAENGWIEQANAFGTAISLIKQLRYERSAWKLIDQHRSKVVSLWTKVRNFGTPPMEHIASLVQVHMDSGNADSPTYTKLLSCCQAELHRLVYEVVGEGVLLDLVHQCVSKGRGISCQEKIAQLDAEMQCKLQSLELEGKRECQMKLRSLASSVDAPQATMTRISYGRTPAATNVTIERDVAHESSSMGSIHQLHLEKTALALAAQDAHALDASFGDVATAQRVPPAQGHAASVCGAIGSTKVFWMASNGKDDASFQIKNKAAHSTPDVIVRMQRSISVVVFNDILRMLAAYCEDSQQVQLYSFDEGFTQRYNNGPPINLVNDSSTDEFRILQMHFLPDSRKLCFVSKDAVRFFDLSSNHLHPKTTHIGEHYTTLTDPRGLSLVVLRAAPEIRGAVGAATEGQHESMLLLDIYIGDGMKHISTLPAPKKLDELFTLRRRSSQEGPQFAIARLHEQDLFIVADTTRRKMLGWLFLLETAAEKCSMEEIGRKESMRRAAEDEKRRLCCFDILDPVLSKYTTHSALQIGSDGSSHCPLVRSFSICLPVEDAGSIDHMDLHKLQRYVDRLVARKVDETHKPHLSGCSLRLVLCESPGWNLNLGATLPLVDLIQQLICLVPLQVARAESNAFVLMQDGLSSELQLSGNVVELASLVTFGFYECILRYNQGKVVVVSTMGKQSTGKSFMLNHLSGSCFDTSGGRCTDGIWLTFRRYTDVNYVLLDFEGLGSFERTAQEDMLLSVFNAAITHVTLFRTENRLDTDTANIFSRMQQGAKLLQQEKDLFRGSFQMVIKDVVQDTEEVLRHEFAAKIMKVVSTDVRDNFFSRLYSDRVGVLASPAIGQAAYYDELFQIVDLIQQAEDRSFTNGYHFLENMKLLMAKMALKDWTPTDQNKVKMRLATLVASLPHAVALGTTLHEDLPMRSQETRILDHVDDADAEGLGDDTDILVMSVLDAVPDDSLGLAELQPVPLERARLACSAEDDSALTVRVTPSLLQELIQKLYTAMPQLENSGNLWATMSKILTALSRRRTARVTEWLEESLEPVKGYGDVKRFLMLANMMLTNLQTELKLCDRHCEHCRLLCMHPFGHQTNEVEHSCGTDHRCKQQCSYCSLPASCASPAGHDGKHDCGDLSHTCGEECSLGAFGNCAGKCVLKPGHAADQPHLCSSQKHYCGKPCALESCVNVCVFPHDFYHVRCECHVTSCPNPCSYTGCTSLCAYTQDHFHSHGCPEECMCPNSHPCDQECEAPGNCEIIQELVRRKERFDGKHMTFDYDDVVTEQTGRKKPCCKVVPAGLRLHDGPHMHSTTEDIVHYCTDQCPTCGYFCTKHINHTSEHDTQHGNMKNTWFVAEEDVFQLGSRKYAPSESGKAEMCSMYCHRAGRGHTHVKLCASYSQQSKPQLFGGGCCNDGVPGRRHSKRKFKPDPEKPKDEFTHVEYWKSINFKDPCSTEDTEEAMKCSHFCPHPSHQGRDSHPSFCTLAVWHTPLRGDEAGSFRAENGGTLSLDGHHFACNHKTTVHTIFIIDRSTSMRHSPPSPSKAPWKTSHPNRLGCALAAVERFVSRRSQELGGTEDTISIGFFSSQYLPGPECTRISDWRRVVQPQLARVQPDFGTNYMCALQQLPRLIAETPADSRCLVMFLSDGEGIVPQAALRRLLQEAPQPVRMQTVLFGRIQSGGQALRAMAQEAARCANGDEFAGASDFSVAEASVELEDSFARVASSLSAPLGGLIGADM